MDSVYEGFSTNCRLTVRSQFYALQVAVSARQALGNTCYFVLLYFMGVFSSAAFTCMAKYQTILHFFVNF